MNVTVNNLGTGNTVADISVVYGTSVETFRGVNLDPASPDFIEKRLANSGLVRVAPTGGGPYPATFTLTNLQPLVTSPPLTGAFEAGDFTDAFTADGSLDKVDIFNLLLLPGIADNGIWSAAEAFCERKRAFLIMDPPISYGADASDPAVQPIEAFIDAGAVPGSTNAALYFPYMKGKDPTTGRDIEVAPSGFVAGVYSRTDLTRGVWKAPAGFQATLRNTTGVVDRGRMTDMKQGVLNPKGVNCIRTFAGVGSTVFGARTVVTANPSFEPWRYVPVRRTALFIEQSLYANLGWAVFEPNDEPLWLALRTTVENFMLSLFTQGAFQGGKPSDAFLVKCDASTTTQTDIDLGIVNIIVGFRPLKPAEFVIIKIAQLAGQVQS
jgi:phage tail sheath protein FI